MGTPIPTENCATSTLPWLGDFLAAQSPTTPPIRPPIAVPKRNKAATRDA